MVKSYIYSPALLLVQDSQSFYTNADLFVFLVLTAPALTRASAHHSTFFFPGGFLWWLVTLGDEEAIFLGILRRVVSLFALNEIQQTIPE